MLPCEDDFPLADTVPCTHVSVSYVCWHRDTAEELNFSLFLLSPISFDLSFSDTLVTVSLL